MLSSREGGTGWIPGLGTKIPHATQCGQKKKSMQKRKKFYPGVCVCVCACVCGKTVSHVRLFVTPMGCSLPGSSVHGILQARILEWVAIPFSKGPSQTRN